jgi:two-component system nitrate/nitrite response regulator NarL
MAGALATIESSASVVRVLVAHAQPLLAEAIGRVVRDSSAMHLVTRVADGRSALAALRDLRPHVAVVDAALPGLAARQLIAIATQEDLPTRIVLIGDDGADDGPYELLAEGAAGCVTAAVSADELLEAITTVADGQAFLAGETHTAITHGIQLRAHDGRPLLSDREREILGRVAAGETSRHIAQAMHLSLSTVKTHLAHVYEKLHVPDRASAVATAMRRGMLD